ncbi:hypothetical protein L7F22_051815 [Adiantum nelumboides]|nr:hypothetical protein [Adiantum nelumboides]
MASSPYFRRWALYLSALLTFLQCASSSGSTTRHYDFTLQNDTITKLCKTRNIITVNGLFPGPVIYANDGDRVIVRVTNAMQYNASIHWHGVRQHFSCWSDGPAYVTQCPIQPGRSFTYEFTLYQQKGTLFWHAHISWLRATVNGAIVIYPQFGVPYPYPYPYEEHVLILGEWWNADPEVLEKQILASGGPPNVSDAYLINGHPGPLYNCSIQDTFVLNAIPGKTYLLRIINAALNIEHFFGVAKHNVTVVAVDGEYVKPFQTRAISITPGQTTEVLLTLDKLCSGQYYMGIGPYMFANVSINSVQSLAILSCSSTSSSPSFDIPQPKLPRRNDTQFVVSYARSLRSLSISDNSEVVPQRVDKSLLYAVGLNLNACPTNQTCGAPNNTKFEASINNVTFQRPPLAMLQAFYYDQNGSFTPNFPGTPLQPYDYSGNPPSNLQSLLGTKADVIEFNSNVQVVLQGTSLVSKESHPIHLHGFSFYVVGYGNGNFQPSDSTSFNLVDPPLMNTVGVPASGWVAIRFKANNPGVWFMHCHLEIHTSWGLATAFVVKNGEKHDEILPRPPADLPPC